MLVMKLVIYASGLHVSLFDPCIQVMKTVMDVNNNLNVTQHLQSICDCKETLLESNPTAREFIRLG